MVLNRKNYVTKIKKGVYCLVKRGGSIDMNVNIYDDAAIYKVLTTNADLGLQMLIDKYSTLILHIINQYPNLQLSQEDKEEIISDCFIQLWKNVRKIDIAENPSLKPYICKIAHNCTLNKYRSISKNLSIVYDDAIDIKDSNTMDELLIKKFLANELLQIIAAFTPKDRACVIGYYYYKKKIKDISKELNISQSNVKITLMRCRKKIKKELERKGLYDN